MEFVVWEQKKKLKLRSKRVIAYPQHGQVIGEDGNKWRFEISWKRNFLSDSIFCILEITRSIIGRIKLRSNVFSEDK